MFLKNFKTQPVDAIRHGHNKYTPTQGVGELREQLLAEENAYTKRNHVGDNLLITSLVLVVA